MDMIIGNGIAENTELIPLLGLTNPVKPASFLRLRLKEE
jgi:hypothetical protein